MTPNEAQALVTDFETARARFAAHAGRPVADADFVVPFAAYEATLAGEAVRRIDGGATWSALPVRPLRALRRWGQAVAVQLAVVGGTEIETHASEIEALAQDDDRLADEIRAALVETAIFDRCGDGKTAGIDTQTIIRAWAAASIRARVEIANRENAE